MAIIPYLAMTGAEQRLISQYPPHMAWMACHFSPYATGLSNLPEELPEGAMLILNDITPIHSHDPEVICRQLQECVEQLGCSSVLLDFQRPGYSQTQELARYLVQHLPCPMAISTCYAQELSCPVFLPSVPCHVPLEEAITPWKGRELWLEIAPGAELLELTEAGCQITQLTSTETYEAGHYEAQLHCHYRIQLAEDRARFFLWRTKEDLDAQLEAAKQLGITTAVGLWQELK